MKDPRTDPPKEGEIVTVLGSDTWGDWEIKAKRKNYKQKPNVFSYNDNGVYWRFIDTVDGEKINHVMGWIS